MPSTHLIDFETLDLSRVIAGPEELRRVLKQRGTFEMLDGVLYVAPEGKLIVGYKDIRADDWWSKDHIPGRPIFPGALMIETAAQLCSYAFSTHAPGMENAFIGFGGLDGTRFRGVVAPPARMVFVGRLKRVRSRVFTYETQGFVDRELMFESEVMGVVV
jgi:3-hydroxymyristoyl/3-hydroxydecanoyl-(acyl carrier protein) dehydratase